LDKDEEDEEDEDGNIIKTQDIEFPTWAVVSSSSFPVAQF
jgi:hypothetical protein